MMPLSPLLPLLALAALPVARERPVTNDWLVQRPQRVRATVFRSADGRDLVLDNGLIRRTFRVAPNLATVGLDNLITGEALLRAVRPEAILTIDNVRYPVGGLIGQPDLGYLRPNWLDQMKSDPAAFRLTGIRVGKTEERLPWRRARHANAESWPPPGASLQLQFAPPDGKLPGIQVTAHYELYDGIPLLSKWLTLTNNGKKAVRLNQFTVESLGFVEAESVVDPIARWRQPNITLATDYAFGGMSVTNANQTIYWEPDPAYTTQVNYDLQTPCVLEVRPPLGPDVDIPPGESFATFRVFALLQDSTDRERQGRAVRRMYRTLAPWSTENPLMLHVPSTDPAVVRAAIDQCAAVGFEMVILSFGSGLDMEDVSPENLAKFKELADYAHAKCIEIGGYSLLASRRISETDDVIDPTTGKTGHARFGNSPCLGSQWGIRYFEKLKTFLTETGFDLLEHDGSYPGDVCASTTHPGHRGLSDSQWTQYSQIADFYRWCRGRGIYLNVPDWYFLVGASKTGMGYRETNWSLPREQQHVHARMHLYDGTWEKTPTMGWMFVPLVPYQGGGAAATIEPLGDHLPDYERHLAANLGYGVQACWRGPRLYDSLQTQALVASYVSWFKAHRAILESDLLHLRRPDGRDWDGIVHVNPNLPERALAMLYNPLPRPITRRIVLPLQATGLTKKASLTINHQPARTVTLDREYQITVQVSIPAEGSVRLLIREAAADAEPPTETVR